MRAAVYYTNRDVRIEERPVPRIGPGELLLRVEASGICGSDVLEWYRTRRAPLVLGHEVAGVVEEVGSRRDRLRAGAADRHHPPRPCNGCRLCRNGQHSLCDTLRRTHFDPGGMAEFVRLPAENVERGTFLVPAGVDAVAASFVEPLACAVRAQRVAGVGPGRSVAVLGSGLAGLLQVQLARALGAAPVVATDLHPFRREAAARVGADLVVDAREDVPAAVREATEGRAPTRCWSAPGRRPPSPRGSGAWLAGAPCSSSRSSPRERSIRCHWETSGRRG
jgi:L-iditol 2-dehydrogenase